MNRLAWFSTILILLMPLLSGCGRSASSGTVHEHADHAGEDAGEAGDAGGVSFAEGRGLRLSAEVINALGLTTAEVEDRSLTAELTLTAHVFAIAPRVLATARVPSGQADLLADGRFDGATLVRIDRSPVPATRLVDLVFELDSAANRRIGDFATLVLAAEPASVLAVPRTAVLDGATGTFVYVVNGDAFLRIPVEVGRSSPDFIEISDGLYPGDAVVATPVDQLWLSELRLTKGGGHSH